MWWFHKKRITMPSQRGTPIFDFVFLKRGIKLMGKFVSNLSYKMKVIMNRFID